MFVFSLVCLIMSVMMVWEHFEVVTCNFWIAFLIFLGRRPRVVVRRLGRGVLERFSGLQVSSAILRRAIRAQFPDEAHPTPGARPLGRRSSNCWKAGRRICSLDALAIPFKWSHRFESLEEPEDATTIGGGWRKW